MVKITKNKKVYEENINNLPARASAIIYPDSNNEIKNLINSLPKNADLIPRGFGINFTASTLPIAQNNSVIVDFSKMNSILDINLVNKTAVVEPGVLVSDLNEELLKYDLEFPIIPLFPGLETIGSMIAKNSSGSREIKYGRTINWIESLEIIDGNGEEKRISKSDLSDFAGMEGTTGLITRAILRLTNRKRRSLTILKSENLHDLFIANRRLRLKQDVCSIDFFNKQVSLLLGLENKYHLFVEFDGEEGAFKNEDYQKFIKIKTKAYKKIAGEGFYILDSLKLFSETVEDYFIYLEEKKIPYFSHLASGVVFICSKNDEKDKNKVYEALLFGAKLKAKISPSLGYGLLRKEFLEKGEANLLTRVKARHDPNCKLNKQKFLECPTKIEKAAAKEEEFEEIAEQEELKQDSQENKENKDQNPITQQQDGIKINNENKKPDADAQQLIEQSLSLRKKEELTPEQKEQIRKIASGFFGGNSKS